MILNVEANLNLIQVSHAHANDLFELIDKDRAHLKPWFIWVDKSKSAADVEYFINSAQKQFEQGNGFQFVIEYEKQLVGCLGQHNVDNVNRKTSLGYWLGSDFTGRGIMHKTCASFIEYIFLKQDIHRIQINAATHNLASEKVAKRLGFSHEGVLRDNEWIGDKFVDHNVFGLLRDEWQKTNSN